MSVWGPSPERKCDGHVLERQLARRARPLRPNAARANAATAARRDPDAHADAHLADTTRHASDVCRRRRVPRRAAGMEFGIHLWLVNPVLLELQPRHAPLLPRCM